MKDKFVNLHLHTHYSVPYSIIRIPKLFEVVKQYGQNAVAITDYANTQGWTEFYLASEASNVKPIFGCEFYCKEYYKKPSDKNRYHLVVLAKNDNGIKTINRLLFESTKHFYFNPLLPYPFLFENCEDIFVSTACALGTIGQCFDVEKKNKSANDAEVFLCKLLDIFGKDNVALEFQFHPTWKSDKKRGYYPQNFINEELLNLWDAVDMKYCIATTDAHFIDNPDARRNLSDNRRYNRFYEDMGPSLKSNCVGNSELVKQFAEESNFSDLKLVDAMIDNTSCIADKCNVNMVNNIGGQRLLPKFDKHSKLKEIFFTNSKNVI